MNLTKPWKQKDSLFNTARVIPQYELENSAAVAVERNLRKKGMADVTINAAAACARSYIKEGKTFDQSVDIACKVGMRIDLTIRTHSK